MSFETRRLSSRVEGYSKILGFRDGKLTWMHDQTLWIVRGGEDARAWMKQVDDRWNGLEPWGHGRPPLDGLLRSLPVYVTTRKELDATLPVERIGASSGSRLRRRRFREDNRPEAGTRLRTDWDNEIAKLGDRWDESEMGENRREVCEAWIRGERLREGETRLPEALSNEDLHRLRCYLRRVRRLEEGRKWVSQFPGEVLSWMDRHDFAARRWHLLNLWLRVPEGRELFEDSPQLAWLMASSWNVREKPVRRPLRSLRALVGKPRRRILEWLGLPGSDGTLRLLRRIPAFELRPLTVRYLVDALRRDEARFFLQNHGGPLSTRVLYFLGRDEPVSRPLLEAIGANQEAGPPGATLPVQTLYFDVRRLLWGLGRDEEKESLRRIRSPDRLRQWHDELVGQYNREVNRANRWEGRLEAPLVPMQGMHPLETVDDLIAEGRMMEHCVASYGSRVAVGDYYVYAIWSPLGRATLGIVRGRGNRWRIAELRGYRNASVPPELENELLEWIESQGAKRGGGKPKEPDPNFDAWEELERCYDGQITEEQLELF